MKAEKAPRRWRGAFGRLEGFGAGIDTEFLPD